MAEVLYIEINSKLIVSSKTMIFVKTSLLAKKEDSVIIHSISFVSNDIN